MALFAGLPVYDRYRALRLTDPVQRGEDVYALQKALNFFLAELETDGILGKLTDRAITEFQAAFNLTADGIAGSATQEALARRIANKFCDAENVPRSLARGAVSHESSFRLGNYSAPRSDGSFDAGVVQRNTNFHSLQDAFNPVDSIRLWVDNTKNYYRSYSNLSNDPAKRWGLAAGAWNAPAYANYFAGVRPWAEPGPTAREAFLHYVDSVTAYLVV